MVQWIKELICKWRGHTWVVAKRENIGYRNRKTTYVCKCCGRYTTIKEVLQPPLIFYKIFDIIII